MSHKVIEVVFTTKSQSNAAGRFTVPSEVCQALGIDKGSDIELFVESGGAWHGPVVKQLISDREPSPVGEMRDWMQAGEEITVRVRRA
jgi:bifunctional DNA-binding transcriptional regulator/antitoxin component of YhaV-PrlF toxin-antitoxin module